MALYLLLFFEFVTYVLRRFSRIRPCFRSTREGLAYDVFTVANVIRVYLLRNMRKENWSSADGQPQTLRAEKYTHSV